MEKHGLQPAGVPIELLTCAKQQKTSKSTNAHGPAMCFKDCNVARGFVQLQDTI
jgi:hypothetical protein